MYEDGTTQYENAVMESNKFNKQHPMDCGKKDCLLCHGHKIYKKLGGKKRQAKYKESFLEEDDEFDEI